jgi:cytoskeletal protein CcmA (bactofilin family)
MINEPNFREFHYNMLGSRSTVVGELKLYGDTIITCKIEGSIEIFDEGKLILERGSLIKGKIKAIDVEIFGEVEGDIDCEGLVSIRSSAQVSGTIKAGRLVIYPGAIVETHSSSLGLEDQIQNESQR